MSARLYYDNSHITTFTARVVETTAVGDQQAVVLDQTYFYPTGGGQPHDTGSLAGIPVIDVQTREEDHAVLHVLEEPIANKIEEVKGQIDWKRRFDHMQHHTGQHILTQAFVQVAGAQTVGFHLGTDVVTIDLDQSNIGPEIIASVEDLANQIIWENRPVDVQLIDPEDTEDVRMRRRPEYLETAGLRVIRIRDFDTTACGGTHVAHTGEIGILKILKLEAKGEETRVEFICGARALADYHAKHQILTNLSNNLTTGYRDVPESVARLQEEFKNTQQALRAANKQLLANEADRLLKTAAEREGIRIVKQVFEGFDLSDVRALASQLVESPSMVAMLGIPDPAKSHLILARSDDLPYDMNPAIQAAFATLGDGRGGGRPEFVQGGGAPATKEELTAALDAGEEALFSA